MRTVLVVPHGVAARNFLFGRFLPLLTDKGEVTVVHPLGTRLNVSRFPKSKEIRWIDSPGFSEGVWGYFIRRSFLLGHMRVCNTTGMRHVLAEYSSQKQPFSPKGVIDELAMFYSRFAMTHDRLRQWTLRYQNHQYNRPAYVDYLKILVDAKPDVIFCCDQRPPEMAAVSAAARTLKIPIGTFIFSWDNLSSKGRMPCDYDFYCVWSKKMKEELLAFYPFIDPNTVYVTGTPQFEYCFDQSFHLSKTEFCQKYNVDPKRPVLCFSGEDARTDPENPERLSMLCQLVKTGKIKGYPQILARPTPIDLENRWVTVRNKYPDIIWSFPQWEREPGTPWNRVVPTLDDLRLLANCVRHCHCCVTMVSTMILDFAVAGKPTVDMAFDLGDPPPHGIPVWDKHFQFEHYKSVVEIDAAHIARSPDDLADKINTCLRNPDQNLDNRERLIQLELDNTQEFASQNLVEVLSSVS